MTHWLWFWAGWIIASAVILLAGCDLPTEYTVNSPECPWPPPSVLDASIGSMPLGCPWTDANGNVVDGWWAARAESQGGNNILKGASR